MSSKIVVIYILFPELYKNPYILIDGLNET